MVWVAWSWRKKYRDFLVQATGILQPTPDKETGLHVGSMLSEISFV